MNHKYHIDSDKMRGDPYINQERLTEEPSRISLSSWGDVNHKKDQKQENYIKIYDQMPIESDRKHKKKGSELPR